MPNRQMMMMFSLLIASCLFDIAHSSPGQAGGHSTGDKRRPFEKGNFTVKQFQLHPENAFWDTQNCVVYFRSVTQFAPFPQLLLTAPTARSSTAA